MTLSIHAHTSLNVNYTWPKGTGKRRTGGQERKKGDVFIKLNTREGLSLIRHACMRMQVITHMHIDLSTRSSTFFLTGPLHKNESVLSFLLSVPLFPRHPISHLVPAYNTAHMSWLAWDGLHTLSFSLSPPHTYTLSLSLSSILIPSLSISPSSPQLLIALSISPSRRSIHACLLSCAVSLFSLALCLSLHPAGTLLVKRENIDLRQTLSLRTTVFCTTKIS